MSGSFATSDRHEKPQLRPLRVASLKQGVYEEAKNMVADLPHWELVATDDAKMILSCRRKGGFVAGASEITIRVDGPDGIPSSTVHVESKTQGGLFSRDKQNVAEFMVPFNRRVC